MPGPDYNMLRDAIVEELPDYTDEDRAAVYGYILAHQELDRITFAELEELRELLGLTVEKVETLRV